MDDDAVKTLGRVVELAYERYYQLGMSAVPDDPVEAARLSISYNAAQREFWAAEDALKAALATSAAE